MQLTLGDALPTLMPTYRSIDLRCALAFHINEWVNISTVVRFTYQKTDEVKKIYSSQSRLFPTINTPRIKIIRKALPINSWQEIREQITTGYITLNGLKFKITPVNPDLLPCIIAKNPLYILSEGWNIAEAVSQTYTAIPFERYEQDLTKLGYPTTYNALNIWLQTKYTTPLVPEIIIAAPVYAKILRSECRTERILRIVVEKKKTLKNLRLTVEVIRESVEQAGLQETLQLHTIPITPKREEATIDLRLPAALKADQIKVSLISIKPKPITLDWAETVLQKQPPTTKNPLLTLFSKLRDLEHIQDYIQKEEPLQVDAFYNAVTWMLSLCGFSTIYLGDTAKKRRGYIRQIELIGSDQLSNSVILGLRAGSEDQIRSCVDVLEKVRDAMQDELGSEAQITPILFYRKIAPQAEKRLSESKGIILLDNLELNKIIELLKNGNIRKARHIFGA